MKKLNKLFLSVLCCVMCFGIFASNIKAEEVIVDSIRCNTTLAASRLTFSSYAKPYSVSQGTYKVESVGIYDSLVGRLTSGTYVATGVNGASITNQGLPSSSATKWVSVTSWYYLNNALKHIQTV